MLKQRVIIKDPAGAFHGKEGIVVVVRLIGGQGLNSEKGNLECKVLVGNEISNWIPLKWLDLFRKN